MLHYVLNYATLCYNMLHYAVCYTMCSTMLKNVTLCRLYAALCCTMQYATLRQTTPHYPTLCNTMLHYVLYTMLHVPGNTRCDFGLIYVFFWEIHFAV